MDDWMDGCMLLLLLLQNVVDKEGRLAQLRMTAEDEQQLLAENPALRQIYEASVSSNLGFEHCSAGCTEG